MTSKDFRPAFLKERTRYAPQTLTHPERPDGRGRRPGRLRAGGDADPGADRAAQPTSPPAPTATSTAAAPQASGSYVLDTTSCPSQSRTRTAPGGRTYLVAVSDGPYPDADIAQSLSFEVFLEGRSLPALEAAHADELGSQRYHVRQTFDAGQLPPGTYQVTITLTLAGQVRAYDDVTGQIITLGPQTWADLSGCAWIIGER